MARTITDALDHLAPLKDVKRWPVFIFEWFYRMECALDYLEKGNESRAECDFKEADRTIEILVEEYNTLKPLLDEFENAFNDTRVSDSIVQIASTWPGVHGTFRRSAHVACGEFVSTFIWAKDRRFCIDGKIDFTSLKNWWDVALPPFNWQWLHLRMEREWETLIRLIRTGEIPVEQKPLEKRTTRRRRPALVPKPLTVKQVEVVQIVGECKGDIAEAARRLKKDRKTVEQHYAAANRKLGVEVVAAKPRTTRIPRDSRGQENLAGGDDRRK